MKCKLFFILFISMITFSAVAQDVVKDSTMQNIPSFQKVNILKRLYDRDGNKGTVTITQPMLLNELLTRNFNSIDGATQIKVDGYRVQLFAGSNSRQAREAAQKIAKEVRQQFDYRVYSLFDSPRWICRVGDFQTYEAANQAMRELRAKGNYKEAVIVRDKVLFDFY